MNTPTTNALEIPATPAKPGPPTEPKTLVTKIESALRRIERHLSDILTCYAVHTKSPAALERKSRSLDRLFTTARRDLAELRARIAHQKPEFPAQNDTAAPTSSTIRRSTRSTRATERAIADLHSPPTSPLDVFPEIRAK